MRDELFFSHRSWFATCIINDVWNTIHDTMQMNLPFMLQSNIMHKLMMDSNKCGLSRIWNLLFSYSHLWEAGRYVFNAQEEAIYIYFFFSSVLNFVSIYVCPSGSLCVVNILSVANIKMFASNLHQTCCMQLSIVMRQIGWPTRLK